MNLKQYAIEKGMSLEEAKIETGLDHWNSTVPADLVEAVLEEDAAEDTPDVEIEVEIPDEPDAPDDPTEQDELNAIREIRNNKEAVKKERQGKGSSRIFIDPKTGKKKIKRGGGLAKKVFTKRKWDSDDLEEIELSIRTLGSKSPFWHLRDCLED